MSTEGVEIRLAALRREYESPVWTCLRCSQDHWHGSPEDGCDDCGFTQEVHP